MNNEMKIGSLSSQTRYSCLGKDLEVVPTKKNRLLKTYMWQNQKIVITGVTLEKLTRGKMMNLKVRTGDRSLDSFTLMMYRVKEGHFKLVKSFVSVRLSQNTNQAMFYPAY